RQPTLLGRRRPPPPPPGPPRHTRTVRSALTEASRRPSGLKATPLIATRWPDHSADRFHVRVSQSTTVLSSAPWPASHRPSGLKASAAPTPEKISLPLAISGTLVMNGLLSSPHAAAAIRAPSGLTATFQTDLVGASWI